MSSSTAWGMRRPPPRRRTSLRPVALWSSDLARARETCAYLEMETGLTSRYDERLREFHGPPCASACPR